MARNGETFDMKFNVRNTYVPELRGFIYNETHLSYVSPQKMYTIVETCASTQNVYNQNVKKSIHMFYNLYKLLY